MNKPENIQATPLSRVAATVVFDPEGTEVQLREEENLLDCARRAAVRVASVCGGRGICKSCIVQFTEGEAPPPSEGDRQLFSEHKLRKGWRRACLVKPRASARINVPAQTRATSLRHQLDGNDYWVQPDTLVQSGELSVPAPTLEDPRADADRLLESLNEAGQPCQVVDFALLGCLPALLRQHDWRVQAVRRQGEVIAVQPVNSRLLGLAVDVGTTNIGVLLVDLQRGTTLASDGIENPQRVHGGDVVSRVAEALQFPEKAREMQQLTVAALNQVVARLCGKCQLSSEQIVDVVLAGNTVMQHLLLGLPVDNLAVVPYMPVVNAAVDIKARELQLITAPGAWVHVMENIAGNVGGDHSAMLLGIRADEERRTVLALDIGTNTEISLIHQGRISCLSCPSGPALEGGHISAGMRAAEGAIESVTAGVNGIQIGTIGETTPVGLCGSGVIDATAAFYRDGGIDASGRITGDYVLTREVFGKRQLVLYEEEGTDHSVAFTQEDVRAVQLAKGAIRVGIELLLEEAGISAEAIDRVVIAGGFGAYINIDSARTIGMLPDLPDERFEQVGNAAGIGAKLALLSYPLRTAVQSLARDNQYIEMAGHQQFNHYFMTLLGFPPLERALRGREQS